MEYSSDEMQKLMKLKLPQWQKAAQTSLTQSASASMGKKAKKGAEGAGPKAETFIPDTTPAGEKKDMSKPMAQ